jgi:putative endonuclease
MDDKEWLVFVEVRYRRNRHFGGALESIDRAKRSRLLATAQCYLSTKRVRSPSRFDVVAVELTATGERAFVWIKDAIRDT